MNTEEGLLFKSEGDILAAILQLSWILSYGCPGEGKVYSEKKQEKQRFSVRKAETVPGQWWIIGLERQAGPDRKHILFKNFMEI